MSPVPYNYAPGTSEPSTAAEILVGLSWDLLPDTPLQVLAVRTSDGQVAIVEEAALTRDPEANQVTVATPFGAGESWRVLVLRARLPVQVLDWRNNAPINVRDLMNQLNENTIKPLQQIYHAVAGNEAEGSPGFVVISFDQVTFPPPEARKNRLFHFDGNGAMLLFAHEADKMVFYDASNNPQLTTVTEFGRLLLAADSLVDFLESIGGLGTMAEQDADNVNITGGSITGTDLSGSSLPWGDLVGVPPLVDAAHTHLATDISDSTATGRSLLTAASAATARVVMGLGTIATQNASNVSITGGQAALDGLRLKSSNFGQGVRHVMDPDAQQNYDVTWEETPGAYSIASWAQANLFTPTSAGQARANLGVSPLGAAGGAAVLVVAKNGNDTLAAQGRAPYLTIGAAMSAASAGTTILIMPGTYSENLIAKSNVHLCSAAGLYHVEVAGGSGHALNYPAGNTEGFRCTDIVFLNSSASNATVRIANSGSGTISANVFQRCSAGNASTGSAWFYQPLSAPGVAFENSLVGCYATATGTVIDIRAGGIQLYNQWVYAGTTGGNLLAVRTAAGAGIIRIVSPFFVLSDDAAPILIESGAGQNTLIHAPAFSRNITTMIGGAGASNAIANATRVPSLAATGDINAGGNSTIQGNLEVVGHASGKRRIIDPGWGNISLSSADSGALVVIPDAGSANLPVGPAPGVWFDFITGPLQEEGWYTISHTGGTGAKLITGYNDNGTGGGAPSITSTGMDGAARIQLAYIPSLGTWCTIGRVAGSWGFI